MDRPSASPTSAESANNVLVWHPAFGAIAWIWRWGWWSLLLAVVCEAFGNGLTPTLRLGSIGARALTIWAGIGFGYLLLVWVHAVPKFYRTFRFAMRARAWGAALRGLGIVAASCILYGLILFWAFHWLNVALETLRLEWLVPIPPERLGEGWGVAAAGALMAVLWRFGSMTLHQNRRVLSAAGSRYLLKGYALMTVMRLRQNRRDFFVQAPLVSNVNMMVAAVVVHACAGGLVFSWLVPGLIVLLSIVLTAGELCPPLWLLLGRSTFDAHHLHTTLRYAWSAAGINLLDRSSDEWLAYYRHWHQSWKRAGKFVPFNPHVARTWSLRPRGDLWEVTAWNLMGFVQVVVIDGRTPSRHVDDEILWAAEFGIIDKVWIVAADDGSVPALHSALAWAAADDVQLPPGSVEALSARVVVKARLAAAQWPAEGLSVPPEA